MYKLTEVSSEHSENTVGNGTGTWQKSIHGSRIKHYFKKVVRYFLCADSVASATFVDIMTLIKVTSGQKICQLTLRLDIFRLEKNK